mmetsp:Transcript_124015/g.246958  ORF Transcript_124015/g.246958 Transcript_124015/m.246958 type:complete len:298 (-) Transcript_124015:154-1047(-)|eukprot:CAMPEP_0172723678 /NCGR_PEP_ID=MMETSP1074-20121228/84217_1 /TAXON_ID=2916 /ORGANISM="Ceratium fusus, Strain PA161109" /LENGTH=297 /DNA_ID=CAMNT_0013549963 /DNA_START=22 /DNA_END=915 /DNA_ORIENTATION=-
MAMGQTTVQMTAILLALLAFQSEATAPPVDSMKHSPLCDSMPYVELGEALWSNLGGHGPNQGAEGLIWRVQANRQVGLPKEFDDRSLHDLQLHVHAVTPYENNCPKCNGIERDLGKIFIESGRNVSLVMYFHDAVTKRNVTLPQGTLTFFDFDTENANTAIEFVTVQESFAHTYTAYGTTLLFQKEPDKKSITFWANVQGVAMDNPFSPWILTPTQKRKSLTLQFDFVREFKVTLGSINTGSYARGMLFAFHPGILCALTRLPNGVMVPATDSSLTGNPVPVLQFGERSTAYHNVLL